jgi:hypothetical protein
VLLAVDPREVHGVLHQNTTVVGAELIERDVVERLLLGGVLADRLGLLVVRPERIEKRVDHLALFIAEGSIGPSDADERFEDRHVLFVHGRLL